MSENRGREDAKRSRIDHGKGKISENRGRKDVKRNQIVPGKTGSSRVIYSTIKTPQVGAKPKGTSWSQLVSQRNWKSWFEGNCVYWNAAAISKYYDDKMMDNCIELFCSENLGREAETE